MTDRHAGYIVVLDEPIREDDAQATLEAITMIRGVLRVEPVIDNIKLQLSQIRVRHELGEKLWRVLYPEQS